MKNKGVFKRVETKYLLNTFQYHALRAELEGIAGVDQYGETPILNIYYDTPDFRLIRTSLDKPLYKEKLRLRSYGTPSDESTSFVEIKKKFQGVVYKRRVPMRYADAVQYLNNDLPESNMPAADLQAEISEQQRSWGSVERQISGEINYFRQRYLNLIPQMVVSYDRIAMFGINDPELRITFDRNIRWRTSDLDLRHSGYGHALLQPDQYLMEIKIMGAMPVELANILSRLKIFSVSYSKYGSGYRRYFQFQTNYLVTQMLENEVSTLHVLSEMRGAQA